MAVSQEKNNSHSPTISSSRSGKPFINLIPYVPKQPDDATREAYIPNEPYIPSTDNKGVAKFLTQELACPVLDELHPYLYLVARMSSSHINPLHEHLLKGSTIIIAENPGLHLVWHYKKLYVKPFPEYLFSEAFWEKHLPKLEQDSIKSSNRRAALGLVRSYSYLIRHESDFHIARKNHLISKNVIYKDFQTYVDQFRDIHDDEVSLRWQFGQLRLTRLNWAVRLFQPSSRRGKGILQRLFYQERFWHTSQVIEEFRAPLLAIFASLSLILSAMQVGLAAYPQNPWIAFVRVSWGFSLAIIILLAILFVSFVLFFTLVYFLQFRFSRRERKEQKLQQTLSLEV